MISSTVPDFGSCQGSLEDLWISSEIFKLILQEHLKMEIFKTSRAVKMTIVIKIFVLQSLYHRKTQGKFHDNFVKNH